MGMEIEVIKTPSNVDLESIYATMEAIETGFDWYLGDDHSERAHKYADLRNKLLNITKAELLEAIKGNDKLREYLSNLPSSMFSMALTFAKNAIANHEDGNTHLSLNYDKVKCAWSLGFSCSENLRHLLEDCLSEANKDGQTCHPLGDFVLELNPKHVISLAKKFKRMGFRLWLAKWIGYFLPAVEFRMSEDIGRDLALMDTCVDAHELAYYKEFISDVASEVDAEIPARIWLTTSY